MKYFMVFIGGGAGAVCRFLISTVLQGHGRWRFPAGTLTVNVIGSLLIGMVIGYLMARPEVSPLWKFLLVAGFLGGFTTFSSFSWETLGLLEKDLSMGLLNIAANVLLCLAASFAGLYLIRLAL